MKKTLCLVLSLVTLLTGALLPAIAEEDVVELTFMHWEGVDSQAEFQQAIEVWEASHPGYKIKQLPVDNTNYLTKLTTMAASHTLPDLFQMSESSMIYWGQEGAYADMTGWFDDAPEKLDVCGVYDTDGNLMFYTYSFEVECLFYDKAFFDEAGEAYPPATAEDAWTWDEFVAVAKRLTKDENGLHPDDEGFDPEHIVTYGAKMSTSAFQLQGLCVSNGGGIISPDGKELWLDKPETIEAIQKLADLINVHHVSPRPAAAGNMSAEDVLLATGQVAMLGTGTWIMGTSVGLAKERGELDYGIGVLPIHKVPATTNNGGALVVSSDTAYMDVAKDFCVWFSQVENLWPSIAGGLVQPFEKQYYEDEELMRAYADNDRHPDFEQFRTAFIDYAYEYTTPNPWYRNITAGKIYEILDSMLTPVFEGTKTAEDVIINDIMPVVQPMFDANDPNY